jgi:hypothetical protein
VRGDPIHVDCCPDCGMPSVGHGLDPALHHQCKVGWDQFVPVLYVPAGVELTDADREALLEACNLVEQEFGPLRPELEAVRVKLQERL